MDTAPLPAHLKTEADFLLLRWAVVKNIPFNAFDDSFWHAFLNKVRATYDAPCIHQVYPSGTDTTGRGLGGGPYPGCFGRRRG
jgi:hypothetical protein